MSPITAWIFPGQGSQSVGMGAAALAASAEIEAQRYGVALVVGMEQMKTVDPATGADFLGTWNAYLWPSQVIRGDLAHETVQIGLERLRNNDIDKVNLVTGGLVIAALPIFIMLVTFQRQLVRGLTAGAVKG